MAYSHSRHKASSHPKGPAVIGCYHAVTSPCSVSLSPSGEMMACIYCGLQFAVIWMCMASFPGCDTSIMWLWSGEGSTRPVWTARLSAARCWCSVTDGTRVCRSWCVATRGEATRLDRFPACRQIWNSATWEDATLRNPLAGYWSTQKKQAVEETKDGVNRPKLWRIQSRCLPTWLDLLIFSPPSEFVPYSKRMQVTNGAFQQVCKWCRTQDCAQFFSLP